MAPISNGTVEVDTQYTTAKPMSRELVLAICQERGMWGQPQLNTQLFLNYKGFKSINGLEEYVNVRCLHLGNNNVEKIEGLDKLANLRTLHLECNRIQKTDGLEKCLALRQLNLENNAIKRVDGMAGLVQLEQLSLAGNQIEHLEDMEEIQSLPSLINIDVSRNLIEEDTGVVEFWAEMKSPLKLLRYHGNPGARKVIHYRKRLINSLPALTYLDDRPIFAQERRASVAWEKGGYEAMQQAKRDHVQEQKAQLGVDPERREFLTRRRKLAVERIEREERERKEQEDRDAAERASSLKTPEPGTLEGGDLEALANYEKSWQTKVSLHGLDAVRNQVAAGAEGAASCAPTVAAGAVSSTSSRAGAGGFDFKPLARRGTGGGDAEGRVDAASAAEAEAAATSFVHPAAQAAVAEACSRAAVVHRQRAADRAITRASVFASGAADFLARQSRPESPPPERSYPSSDPMGRVGGGRGAEPEDPEAVYSRNEERQFAVLGDDPWAESSIGSSWRNTAGDGTASSRGGGGPPRGQDSQIVPDIWRRNAEANREAELQVLDRNLQNMAESATQASILGELVDATGYSTGGGGGQPATSSDLADLD